MFSRSGFKIYFNLSTGELLEEKLTLLTILRFVFFFAKDIFRMVFQRKPRRCVRSVDMQDKTVIITGGGSGLGKETALNLARRGARVILACLFVDEATKARDEIIAETGNDNVVVRYLDVSSMKSVRQFSSDILRTEKRLHVLINNAGVAGTRGFTEEGHSKVMATNYLGPFLLTHLLSGLLVKSSPSRVVNVSSCLHHVVQSLDLDSFSLDASTCYSYSKLYLLMFTVDLARKLEGAGVTVNALHPGVVNTSIFDVEPQWLYYVLKPITMCAKTVKAGAETHVYLSVAAELKGVTGKYFVDSREESNVNKLVLDPLARQELWRRSEAAVGMLRTEKLTSV